MTAATASQIFATLEATWPPASTRRLGPWTIRTGQGGGRRVSATTGAATADIKAAEAAMFALNQPALFMIRDSDAALDQALNNSGYRIFAPTSLFCCPIETLASQPVPPMTALSIWPPLAIMNEIWAAGAIDAPRRAIMTRAKSPKTAIFSRAKDRPAGCAFVAIHHDIAMIHVIEVTSSLRRNGAALNIMRAAAHWAQDQGARHFSLAVTDANLAAIGLYSKLGLTVVGHYHYRIRQEQ